MRKIRNNNGRNHTYPPMMYESVEEAYNYDVCKDLCNHKCCKPKCHLIQSKCPEHDDAINVIAKEVIKGYYGNAPERSKRIAQEIQKRVNEIMTQQ